MAQLDDLYSALKAADAAGDTAGAQKLATYIQSVSSANHDATLAKVAADPISQGARDFAKDMPSLEQAAAGLGKSMVDTGRGVASLFGNTAGLAESRRLDKPLMDTPLGMAGNVTGNIGMTLLPGGVLKGLGTVAGAAGAVRAAGALGTAGTAMLAPTSIPGAAALGAGMGAIQPAENTSERLKNALMGAGAGAGGQALFKGAANALAPNVAPEVKALMAEGVTPTPGQILGGGWKRAEEGATSLPLIGDAIRTGQRRAVGDLNTAAFNRALDPVGETLPKGMAGRDAVEYVGDRLGAKYDALLPKLTTQADSQFGQGVAQVRSMVATGAIDPTAAASFNRILKNDVLGKFQGQNAVTGQTLKDIESDLGQHIKRLGASTDADQRLVGDALQQVQSELRDLVQRTNPQYADELKAINTGYANFKRVQKAAGSLGATDGVFSPAQLQSAVKAGDRSKDKARFAEGNALMQDLSEPGKSVLGNTVPDSGTPYRSLLALLAGGGGAHLLGGPVAGAATLGAGLAAPLVYSRGGQAALAALLAGQRPQQAVPVANALRQLAPYATAPAIGATSR